MNEVVIYTDGACKGNPGPGGWGALLRSADGSEKELCGGELGTTNNRMEMMAVIEALAALKRPCDVVLHLDSQYVLKGITEVILGWRCSALQAGNTPGHKFSSTTFARRWPSVRPKAAQHNNAISNRLHSL